MDLEPPGAAAATKEDAGLWPGATHSRAFVRGLLEGFLNNHNLKPLAEEYP